MRKILITILLAAVLCVTAFATKAPAEDVVIRVCGEIEGGESIFYGDYKSHAEGWEAAIDLAEDRDEMAANGFDRVVIDFYADWNVGEAGGVFGSGDGFWHTTLYIPDDVRLTINLNGCVIDRGLVKWEYDGEVLYIDDSADVIISDGTITGGWSCNGAGGIHINDNANVVLDDVEVVGNCIEDDDGTGIAVYDGATLTMNGGCVSDNTSYGETFATYGGGVYVEDATAYFTDVTFENNQGFGHATRGAVLHADDSTVVMDGCLVTGNGVESETDGYVGAATIVEILGGSEVTMTDTDFFANGYAKEASFGINTKRYSSVIRTVASALAMEACTLSENSQVYLMDCEAAMLTALDSDFSGNDSFAFFGNCAGVAENGFTNCKFSYTEPMLELEDTFYFNTASANVDFVDCDFGGATFNDPNHATVPPQGSIFGSGSVTMLVVMAALLLLIAALAFVVALRKKKS